MSFNRSKYDNVEIKKYNEQSTGPGNYLYNTPIICDNCFNDNPRVVNQKKGVSLNSNVDWRFYYGPIDVESDLLNLNRSPTKNISKQYIPKCEENSCSGQGAPCGDGVVESCNDSTGSQNYTWNRIGDNNLVNFPNCFFPTEDTRLSNPSTNLRGTGWDRFNPLCKNPQDHIDFPGTQMVSTRLLFKDNHRPSVINPNVNNMHPNETLRPSPKVSDDVVANHTEPLYQYDVCG